MVRERAVINIPSIPLEWSDWHPWLDLVLDARSPGGVRIPNRRPGVYEVRRLDGGDERLDIGKTSDLSLQGSARAPEGEGQILDGDTDAARGGPTKTRGQVVRHQPLAYPHLTTTLAL